MITFVENVYSLRILYNIFYKKKRLLTKFHFVNSLSKINILLELSCQLVKKEGFLILLKANAEEELIESKNSLAKLNFKLIKKEEFLLPIENSLRTILKIQKIK